MGRERAGLSCIGPVSDRFQTGFRPVSCRIHSPCHSVHVTTSCQMHSHVGCTEVSCRMHSLDRHTGKRSESGPMLVGKRFVHVWPVRFLLRQALFSLDETRRGDEEAGTSSSSCSRSVWTCRAWTTSSAGSGSGSFGDYHESPDHVARRSSQSQERSAVVLGGAGPVGSAGGPSRGDQQSVGQRDGGGSEVVQSTPKVVDHLFW